MIPSSPPDFNFDDKNYVIEKTNDQVIIEETNMPSSPPQLKQTLQGLSETIQQIGEQQKLKDDDQLVEKFIDRFSGKVEKQIRAKHTWFGGLIILAQKILHFGKLNTLWELKEKVVELRNRQMGQLVTVKKQAAVVSMPKTTQSSRITITTELLELSPEEYRSQKSTIPMAFGVLFGNVTQEYITKTYNQKEPPDIRDIRAIAAAFAKGEVEGGKSTIGPMIGKLHIRHKLGLYEETHPESREPLEREIVKSYHGLSSGDRRLFLDYLKKYQNDETPNQHNQPVGNAYQAILKALRQEVVVKQNQVVSITPAELNILSPATRWEGEALKSVEKENIITSNPPTKIELLNYLQPSGHPPLLGHVMKVANRLNKYVGDHRLQGILDGLPINALISLYEVSTGQLKGAVETALKNHCQGNPGEKLALSKYFEETLKDPNLKNDLKTRYKDLQNKLK